MFKNTGIIAFFSIAVLISANASASNNVSYDFVELRFVDTEAGSVDGDGFQLAGSYNIQDNWLIVGGLTSLDFNGADVTLLEAGGGYVWPQNNQFDLFATGSIVRADIDAGPVDDDETGFRLVGGVRTKFSPNFEGRAELNYIDLDDSDTYIELGGDYYVSPQLAIGGTLDVGGDNDSLTIGVRWFFGDRKLR